MYIDDQTGALIEARVLVTRARQRQIDVQGLLCPAERADPSRPTGGEHEIHEPCEIRGRQPPHQAERRRAHLLHRAQHTLDRWQPVPIDAADDGLGHLHGTRRPARCGQRGHGAGASLLDERLAGTSVRRQPPRRVSSARATRRPCRLIARVAPRTPFGGGGTDIDTTPGTAGAVIAGEGGHEPRPRAPAASRPSHSRPGGRVPRPCRLATCQKGRVARIVDDTGLMPSTSTGPSGSTHAARTCLASWSVPSSGHGFMVRSSRWGGSTGRIRAPYMCTRSPLVAPHTSPSRRRRTFPSPVRPTRANVDGRRLPAATTKEGPAHDPAQDRLDHHAR